MAERAWHQADWQVPYNYSGQVFTKETGVFTEQAKQQRDQQWLNFSRTLAEKELPKLDLAGVFYRLPTVGAKVISGKLNANVALKGLPIEYRQLGENQAAWLPYKIPVTVTLPIEIRTRTTDKKRAGRTMTLTKK